MRTGYSGNQSGNPYRTYVCPKWHVVRKASYVEAIVEGAMCERLRDPNIISAMASESGAAGEVQRLRDEANGLRGRLDQITKDYAAGDLTARQLNVATEATEEKLSVVEHRLARIGSSNALMGLMGSPDPGAAWLSLDVNAQATVVKALADVFIHKQALGRRPASANREKHKQWQENLIKSIEVRWHKEPQPLIT